MMGELVGLRAMTHHNRNTEIPCQPVSGQVAPVRQEHVCATAWIDETLSRPDQCRARRIRVLQP